MSTRRRIGFTLVELLVVIAIIAILIALLLPAIQKVREAANRTTCTNNFKQMGIACQSYNDVRKSLPPGWAVTASSNLSPGWSWASVILPYIEQGALATQAGVDDTGNTFTPASTASLQTSISTYLCPSDVPDQFNVWSSNGGQNAYPNAPSPTYARTNYACNRAVLGPDNNTKPTKLTLSRIKDGTSNTILLGERDYTNNVGALWFRPAVTSASFEGRPGTAINFINAGANGGPPNTGTGNPSKYAWGSQHPTGCNFALCDGSVRFVNENVQCDPSDNWNFPINATNFTMQNLHNPSDRNVIKDY